MPGTVPAPALLTSKKARFIIFDSAARRQRPGARHGNFAMPNTVTFTPTLAQFTAAADQLNTNPKEGRATELRFKAYGTGFAVTWTDRFLVRVADFFCSAKTVEQRKAEVLTAFFAAARGGHDKKIETLSKEALSTGGKPAKALSARAVLELPRHAALHNEVAIRKACYGVPDLPGSPRNGLTTATPALADIVDPVVKELLQGESAPSDLLTPEDLDKLRHDHVGHTPNLAHPLNDKTTCQLSRKIETALRAIVKENPTHALNANTIVWVGRSAVRLALTRDINRIAYQRHCESHPFADDFRAQIQANAQKNNTRINPSILSKDMFQEFERIEQAMVGNNAVILNQRGMTALREKLVADVISHQAAITRIETLNLPQGAEKTDTLLACLDIAPKRLSTNESADKYLTCLEKFAEDIGNFIDRLGFEDISLDQAADSPSPQQAAFSTLDNQLWKYLVQTGNAEAAGIHDFVAMSVNVFAVRATPETLDTLGQHLRSTAVQTIAKNIQANAGGGNVSENEIRSASRLNRIVHLLSQIVESRRPSTI